MNQFLYNPPRIVKLLFNRFYWDSRSNEILITFDDGPNPGTTEIILELLNKQKIKALFFLVGENINKYPDLVKKILNDGHEIGNHTMNHAILTKLNKVERIKEIRSVQKIMLKNFGYSIRYFRPPHGRFFPNLSGELKELGLKNVMWSLLTYDFKNDFATVKSVTEKHLGGNSIVVFHDSKKSSKIIAESLELLFKTVEAKHFVIGEPNRCLN